VMAVIGLRAGFRATCSLLLFSTLGWGSDLTEAAQKVDAYWAERFTSCVHARFGELWYVPISDDPGGNRIYARLGASAHFRTEELTEIDRVNGVEFKAVSYLLSRAGRSWAPSSGWTDWQPSSESTEVTRIFLVKRNGVWSITGSYQKHHEQKIQCAQVPQ
jgi:hypothetical protein